MVDPAVVRWLEERLRQQEQSVATTHRKLLSDLLVWRPAALEPELPRDLAEAAPPRIETEFSVREDLCGQAQNDELPPEVSGSSRSTGRRRLSISSPLGSGSRLSDSAHGWMSEHTKATLQKGLSARAGHLVTGDDDVQDIDGTGWLSQIVAHWRFDAFFACLIMINALFIAAELQYESYALGFSLGWKGAADEPTGPFDMDQGAAVFRYIDIAFGVLFWTELVLKFTAMQVSFFTSWTMVDFIIMVIWTVDLVLVDTMAVPPTFLRILRLVRVLRLVRHINSYEIFDPLILMMSSVRASLWVLFWSICLLLSIVLLVSLFMGNSVRVHMLDAAVDLDVRLQTYEYFGSFSRSLVSMLELTIGNWSPICRHLMDNISERYGFVVVLVRLLVSEGVLKVISAIFLQQTMQCANNDDQLMIHNRTRQRTRFKQKMKILLQESDSDGSGTVSRKEFIKIMEHPRVKMWLQAMDLNIRNPDKFFSMLDTRSCGELGIEDLISGMSAFKGPAMQLHVESIQMVMLDYLKHIESDLISLHTALPLIAPKVTLEEHNNVKVLEI